MIALTPLDVLIGFILLIGWAAVWVVGLILGLGLTIDLSGWQKLIGVGIFVVSLLIALVPFSIYVSNTLDKPKPYIEAGCYRVEVGTRLVGKTIEHYNTFDPIPCVEDR